MQQDDEDPSSSTKICGHAWGAEIAPGFCRATIVLLGAAPINPCCDTAGGPQIAQGAGSCSGIKSEFVGRLRITMRHLHREMVRDGSITSRWSATSTRPAGRPSRLLCVKAHTW